MKAAAFFAALLIASTTSAKLMSTSDYDFPIKSPSIASLTTMILPTCQPQYQKLKLSGGFKTYLSRSQKPSGRAAFLISGLGGSVGNPLADFLTCEVNAAGYDVFTIPNSFTADYAKRVSASGLPGQPYVDAHEIYNVIYAIYKSESFQRLNTRETKLIGYSHGGILAWHIFQFDRQKGYRLFSDALLMSPPLDMLYGIRELDRKGRLPAPDLLKGFKFLKRTKKLRARAQTDPRPERIYLSYEKEMRLDVELADRYLGAGFKMMIPPVIEEALEKHSHPDFPPLPPLGSIEYRYALKERRQQMRRYSFEDYLNKFIIQIMYSEARVQAEDINVQNSLLEYQTELRNEPRIRIITNSDDFLLNAQHVKWLESTAGTRTLIYPRGGHMGNLLFPHNRAALRHWLGTGHLPHEL